MTETIILDFGSGNTCKNKKDYVKEMYNKLKGIDSRKYKIIVKWQLFSESGDNIPLKHDIFDYAYKYGRDFDYEVTASIFSLRDLEFLLKYEVPFIKIKNDRNFDCLADYIDEKIPVYISHSCKLYSRECKEGIKQSFTMDRKKNIETLFCISEYPANVIKYEKLNMFEGCNISDHTNHSRDGFYLFNRYKPKIIEWHYKLDYSTGLDSGNFARTPEQLKEILFEK